MQGLKMDLYLLGISQFFLIFFFFIILSKNPIKTGELVYEFEGHTEKITEILLISPSEMISCSYDKTIRVWDLMVKKKIIFF